MDAARWPAQFALVGFLAALGIGLLIGLVRERASVPAAPGLGGVRTHALIALAGATAEVVGPVGVGVGGVFLALLAVRLRGQAWRISPVAAASLLITFLLGVVAVRWPTLAAALGVVVFLIVANKTRLHAFSRHTLSSAELHDLLLLAAAAFVVLPLLPDAPLDPWGALHMRRLWILVVAVMAVSSVGYVSLRTFRGGVGLAVAGLAGGVVSSTATVATMGERVRSGKGSASAAACVAMLASSVSTVELAVIAGVLSPALLARIAWPLSGAAATGLVLAFLLGLARRGERVDAASLAGTRPFEPWAVVRLVAVIAVVILVAAVAQDQLGGESVPWMAALSGLVDVHAAAAAVAQLVASDKADASAGAVAILSAQVASSLFKTGLAVGKGGANYGLRVGAGLALMSLAFFGGLVANEAV